jgi:hypothetical protein
MTEIKFKELAGTKYIEMSAWCKEEFGHPALWVNQLENDRSPAKWISRGDYPKEMFGGKVETGSAVFKFREGKDATMFALKWS